MNFTKFKAGFWTIGFMIFLISNAMGQEDKPSSFTFSGFLDIYYGYDFNGSKQDKRLPFLYNHNRHDQLNINLALVNVAFKNEKWRANLSLQQGTYALDNYAHEPKFLSWVNQANFGRTLNKQKTAWIDFGVLPSHIGFENAISTENLTLSRSLIAENSPYFLTGAKLSWQSSEQWFFAFWLTNGWQVISGIEGNSIPSVGTQVTFQASDKITINWSTLIGNNFSNENRRIRYFSNQYVVWKPNSKWDIIGGLDVGWEQRNFKSSKLNFWSGGSIIAAYKWNPNWKTAVRAEFYADKNAVIASNSLGEGLKTNGIGINIDRKIGKLLTFRFETRYLFNPSTDQFFQNNTTQKENLFLLGNMALNLN